MKWTKITIETTTQATDMLSYVLGEYGVQGIQVEDNIPLSEADRKAMYIDFLPELPPDDGVAYVSCYVEAIEAEYMDKVRESIEVGNTCEGDNKFEIKELCRYIQEQLDEISTYMDVGTGRISIGETEDKDWINNWKEFFHPFRLEDNIVIQPTWTEQASDIRDDDIVIQIDPGTAFGTGSHETTRLCIRSLKKYIDPERRMAVMDVGCGSGILSIVAGRLGAAKVYGIDIDELAVKASIENLELNGIAADTYRIEKGDVIGDSEFARSAARIGQYDIVMANILADVIIPLSGVIRPFMKPDGVFISSGIIDTKEDAVKQALRGNGFEVVEVSRMGEWVSIVAR